MRTAELVTDDRVNEAGISDGDTIFNGLLLAVIGHRRLLVLVGATASTRVGLLARLARHVESEGCMVMTVAAGVGVTVEDLVEVAGAGMLGPGGTPQGFDRLVEVLEDRLDQCGTGILMVEEADRLAPDTLRDLVELSGSVTPSGHFLQILLSGGPELRQRLEQAGLMPTIDTVGTLYTLDDAAGPEPGALRVRTSAPGTGASAGQGSARGSGIARRMASGVAILALLAGGWWVYDQGWMNADRIAALVDGGGLENDAAQGDGPSYPDTDLRNLPGPSDIRREQGDDPQQAAPPDRPVDQAEPGFTREDVEQFADLAGRVLREDPRLAGREGGDTAAAPGQGSGAEDGGSPPAIPESRADAGSAVTLPPSAEEPPAAESEPLSADELAAMEAAPEPGSLAADGAEGPAADQEPAAADDVADQDDVAVAVPLPAELTPVQQSRIETLIDRAEGQIADRKLTTPRNDAAFYTMQEIRAIDPDHPVLDDMRRRILDTYQSWADTAEQRRDWQTASVYYQRALRVAPANAGITARLDRVEDIRAGRPPRPAATAGTGRDAPPEPQLRP